MESDGGLQSTYVLKKGLPSINRLVVLSLVKHKEISCTKELMQVQTCHR